MPSKKQKNKTKQSASKPIQKAKYNLKERFQNLLRPKTKSKTSAQKFSSGARKLIRPSYKSFRLHKKIKSPQPHIKSSRKILYKSFGLLKDRWKPLLGILAVYTVLSLIFVKGFATSLNIEEIKEILDEVYTGFTGNATSVFALMSLLIGSSGSTSTADGASAYQSFFLISLGLATIWTLRQGTQKKIRVRDGFYNGFYPLIPLILVLCTLGLQLIPFGVASWLFSTVILGGIAVTAAEQFVWWIFILLLIIVSAYMLLSSLFAIIIVTLPGMAPMQALKSARELVRHRRNLVFRRLIFLPLILVIILCIFMVPFLIWLPVIAEWAFFVFANLGGFLVIAYMYSLYKELLND